MKRFFDVVSSGGHRVIETLRVNSSLNIDLPVPSDVGLFLCGIGDLKDPNDRQFYLAIQGAFTNAEVRGVRGFYGRGNEHSNVIYETLPSPGVCLLKIQADD